MHNNNEEKKPIVSSEEDENANLCCNGNCDTKSRCYRYTLMVLVCFVGATEAFSYDNPAALEDHIMRDLNIGESQYMLFYSSIQWIQIGACLCGGYLVDAVIGVRASIVLSAVILTASQTVFAGGAMINSFWTMVFGRMIYGAMNGVEWLAISKMHAKWFKDKELSFVIGLKMGLTRGGAVININFMNNIYSSFNRHFKGLTSLGLTLFVSAIVCLAGAFLSVIVFFMDKKATFFKSHIKSSDSKGFMNLRNFPAMFWMVTTTLTLYQLVVFTFTGLGQVFFERKYGLDLDVASSLNSLVYLMSAITMPPVGFLIDKVGRNLYWMFSGIALQLSGHGLLTFTFVNPYVAMAQIGLGYTFMALTMFSLLPHVVHMDYLGTAHGIVGASIALGETGATYLAGYLAEHSGYMSMEIFFLALSCEMTGATYLAGYLGEHSDYISMEIFFLALTCASFVFGSLLFVIDRVQGGNLNLRPSDRLVHETKRSHTGSITVLGTNSAPIN